MIEGRGRAVLACLLLLGGAALLWFVAGHDPAAEGAVYPDCPFHLLTGLHCPGCGSARATHALLHLDLGAALGQNPLLVLLLPVLIPALALELLAWAQPERSIPRLRPPVAVQRGMLGAILGFWVLRNLPWAPFCWLAPA